ncbi:T9SS type A sorting domain-containing protein [Psychroflexus sp. CAK8W]|uniref:T9SS type A sorting domain-containing protein n=1 Tax=Psychroflexus longus TaxID=2873596 RepID=A0ABS7XF42_9FLAO|nr:T9SS type A sorting domain-containing protein [Psychroflexus longus]MBZ9777581.1 T9SS type A sorting domain-containing protein [Psychroflexus longus]
MSKIISILLFAILANVNLPCLSQSGLNESKSEEQAVFVSSGSWSNSQNWKNHKLPTSTSKVIIEAHAVLEASVQVKSLEIDENISLTINPSFQLFVTRNIENSGRIFGAGDLVLNGNSAQFIKEKGVYSNLRILNASTVHIEDGIEVSGNLYVDAGELKTKGNLYLRCDFETNKTAQIGEVRGEISGKVQTEQCYPARRANRLISPSVNTSTSIHKNWQEDADSYFDEDVDEEYGTHITGLNPGNGPAYLEQDGENGFDFNPSGNASLFTYDHQQSDFNPINNTNVNQLMAGNPYMILVRGDRTINIYSNSAEPTATRLRAKGELVTGNYTTTDLSQTKDGFSLIGNPYHAQVDMNSVLAKSKNIRKDVYYVWDPKLGGIQDLEQPGGRGAFVVVELPSGNNSSNSEANQYLQPMQAVFVQTIYNNSVTQVNFSESDKAVNLNPQPEILSDSNEQFLNIQLFNEVSYNAGSTPSDALRINFGSRYSNSADDDIAKLKNVDENLTRVINQNLVALERRNMPNAEEVLPLYINQYRRENYTFNFEFSDSFYADVYIIDLYLETETLLSKSNSTYSFDVNSSVAGSVDENRFSLKLKPVSLSTSESLFSEVKIYPNPTKGSFSINGLSNITNAEITIFNMIGQQIYSKKIGAASTFSVEDFNVEDGVYIVKLSSDHEEQSFKLIKEN